MDRRNFLAGSVATATTLAMAMPASAKSASPSQELLDELKSLEKWAAAMRKEIEQAGSECILDHRVLPSIAPWFGRILGTMASLKQA